MTRNFQGSKDLFNLSRRWYEDILAEHNQILLWASPWPPAGIWAKKPLTSAESLSGWKLVTCDAISEATFQKAGARVVPLGDGVMPQVQAGGIDAVLSSDEAGLGVKCSEVFEYYVPINYGTPLNMVTMNGDTWHSLPAEFQVAVREVPTK